MDIRRLVFTTLAVLLIPALSWAGGKATISSDNTDTIFEYDDAGALRMSVEGQDAYMLLRDGRMYSVMDQGGDIMVMEIGPAMAAMGNMVQQQGLMDTDFEAFEGLTDTGRTETVAGIEGRVFELALTDKNGERTTQAIVLSTDERVRELTAAMMAMTDTMLRSMGGEEPEGLATMKQEILGNGRGVLRYGNDYVVSSIDAEPPAASRLQLPAEPVQLPDMSNFFRGGIPGAGATQQPR